MALYPDSKHGDALALGESYQDFVAAVLEKQLGITLHYYHTKSQQYGIGESEEGYEVKLDLPCTETGRLSIEVGEKTRADLPCFTPSGIMRQDNTIWYVQGNRVRIWVFRKAMLRYVFRRDTYPVISDRPPTIQKFYLPVGIAEVLAEHKFNVAKV